MTTEHNPEKTHIVCSVISGDQVRIVGVRSPAVYLRGLRDRQSVCFPVAVFPTYRVRFMSLAGILGLPAEFPLAYVARWLFKAPIVSAAQLPVYHYLDWVRKENPALLKELMDSFSAVAPARVPAYSPPA